MSHVVWSGTSHALPRCLFLTEQLRKEGKLGPPGSLATPLQPIEPYLRLSNGMAVPQLAFGLYKVPADETGEAVVRHAVEAGYRHFDGASFYGNEAVVGKALRKSGVPRRGLFLVGKVWNDAVKEGRDAVRKSVLDSLAALNFGDYFDLFLVHWPVPGYFVEAYRELEDLQREGRIRALGVSNFSEVEYETLVNSGITIRPVVNQLEVSPVMYRASLVDYFQSRGIAVAAYKSLNRGAAMENPVLLVIANRHGATPAQVMIRWGLQKKLIVVAKTSSAKRMAENRDVNGFTLTVEEIQQLDSLTTEAALEERVAHEHMRKTSL